MSSIFGGIIDNPIGSAHDLLTDWMPQLAGEQRLTLVHAQHDWAPAADDTELDAMLEAAFDFLKLNADVRTSAIEDDVDFIQGESQFLREVEKHPRVWLIASLPIER